MSLDLLLYVTRLVYFKNDDAVLNTVDLWPSYSFHYHAAYSRLIWDKEVCRLRAAVVEQKLVAEVWPCYQLSGQHHHDVYQVEESAPQPVAANFASPAHRCQLFPQYLPATAGGFYVTLGRSPSASAFILLEIVLSIT